MFLIELTNLDVGIAVDESNGVFKTPETTAETLHEKVPNSTGTVLYPVNQKCQVLFLHKLRMERNNRTKSKYIKEASKNMSTSSLCTGRIDLIFIITQSSLFGKYLL